MLATFIVLAVIVAVLLILVLLYNSLVRSRVQTEEAWSDITVQLKRRADLIPNLVESVKGYAAHEKQVFEEVTAARTSVLAATNQGPAATAAAEGQFEGALKNLFAVAESYPQLRATENYQQLQGELVDTEDKIQAARRFYNGAVRDLNTMIETFPSNLVAKSFHFSKKEFFEVEDMATVSEPVKVKF